jgi:hypothetical protein
MTILSRDTGLVEASLSAANTFSDGIYTDNSFNFSVAGTWAGTITAQRSLDLGVTWRDVDTFTSNIETYGFDPGPTVAYRVGFKAGEYTSGTANVRIGR